MTTSRAAAVILALCLLAPGRSLEAQIPEKFENLQVLPKDISRGELMQVMRSFALGLGVRCSHCHVGEEGRPLSTYDFPSDDKAPKRMARVMMRMARDINQVYLTQLDTISHTHGGGGESHTHAGSRIEVQCVTCHRGQPRPQSLETVLRQAIADSGVETAVRTYRELKDRYYGGFSYDFRERPLNTIAQELLRQDRAQDALAILALNLETNPESAQAYQLEGDAHLALGHRDAALASYRKALERQPNNPPLRARVDSLAR